MNRKMKDSGVEWIGEIPEGWRCKRLKAVLQERVEKNNPVQSTYILSLTNEKGVIPYEEKGNVGNKAKEDVSGYHLAYPDDIVLNSMNVVIGSVGLSKYYGCVSPVYYMLNKRDEGHDIRYYNYIFQTSVFQQNLKGLGNGILEIRMRIPMSKLNVVMLPVPENKEQQRIADYLDTQTAAIDASIAKTQESIEEYKKLKQAVITQAVTKGIRPGRAMKDSGVEWIGDIPEEWGCIKVKYVTSKIGSGKTPSGGATTYLSEGVRFLRSQNIYNEGLVSEGLAYISAATDEEMKSTRVLFNDVLLNITGGSIGRCCTYPDDTPANVNQHVCIIRCVASKCIAKYMQYCWNSDIGQLSIKLLQNSANREGMSGENISNTFITYPALPEQQEIAAYLDEKCAAIDTLIEKKQAIITELEAYKKSLIYEYVTGKKEVPMAT